MFVRSRLLVNSACAGSHSARQSSTCQHMPLDCKLWLAPRPCCRWRDRCGIPTGFAANSKVSRGRSAIVLLKGCFSPRANSFRDQKCLSRWRGAIERGSRNRCQWDGAAACFSVFSCMCQSFHRSTYAGTSLVIAALLDLKSKSHAFEVS